MKCHFCIDSIIQGNLKLHGYEIVKQEIETRIEEQAEALTADNKGRPVCLFHVLYGGGYEGTNLV